MEFPCEKCNHSFSRKYNLKRHLETCKGRLEPFSCDGCGKQYSMEKKFEKQNLEL